MFFFRLTPHPPVTWGSIHLEMALPFSMWLGLTSGVVQFLLLLATKEGSTFL